VHIQILRRWDLKKSGKRATLSLHPKSFGGEIFLEKKIKVMVLINFSPVINKRVNKKKYW
jgi:hypothetical protein